MKIKYKTNFSGYFAILRGIQLLLKNGTLNFTQLGAYICFVAQADFDERHPNFKVILRDDNELAKEWGCNAVTVYRNRKALIQKGLLIEEDGLTKVPNFFIFQIIWVKIFAKLPLTTLQTLFTKTQDDLAKEKFMIADMQRKQVQKQSQSSKVSSKGDLGLSDEEIDEIDKIMEAKNGGK